MIEEKDVPTIEAIHRLRDLAIVLDQLKLQDECLVVGNCAMQLAQALGLRAVEFQKVATQTISLIARLDAYKSRMCPLFIQAISICEIFAIEDGSDSAKVTLVEVLGYAGAYPQIHPALCAQWFERAIDLIVNLPSAMVHDELRGVVYINYGISLAILKEYSKALAAQEHAVTFYRSLESKYDVPHYKRHLATALRVRAWTLADMGRYEDALSEGREIVSLFRGLAVHGQDEHKNGLGEALLNYGRALLRVGRHEDALSKGQEAVSLFRGLSVHGQDESENGGRGEALLNHGRALFEMGRHEDALSKEQEAVSLFRGLAVHGQDEHKNGLGEALMNHGHALFEMGRHEDALGVEQEAVSLFRSLAVHGRDGPKQNLALALLNHGCTLFKMGRYDDALSEEQEVVSLFRGLAVHG